MQPRLGIFTFDALSFTSPGNGWIVGDKFFLHVLGDTLEMTFVNSEPWFNSVALVSSDEGWVGGSRQHGPFVTGPYGERTQLRRGVLLHYRRGQWHEADLSSVSHTFRDWSISRVWTGGPNEAWASVVDDLGDGWIGGGLLRFDGARWTVQELPAPAGDRWNLIDMCLRSNGDGWAVGQQRSAPRGSAGSALLLARRGGKWIPVPLPDLGGPEARLNHLACDLGGEEVAAGWAGEWLGTQEAVIMRHDGAWKRLDLPASLRNCDPGAIAAPSPGEIWLAAHCGERMEPRFLHFEGDQWEEVMPPLFPDGKRHNFAFTGMSFVSPTEGWAVGFISGGARTGTLHGLVFHYKDGAWKQRNWNWHFWHERWLGLCGY